MSESQANNPSGTKTKIEVVILIILLAAAVVLGIPAYKSYVQLEKALAVFQEADECLHNNDTEGARAKFEECIKIYPELRGAYEELAAIALFDDHDVDKACKIYDQAISIMPGNSDLYVSYSQMMFTVQNYEKARDLAKKAVELDPKNTMATSHYDLFERMVKDPELRKNHQNIIDKQGNRASLMPGAHHHYEPSGENGSAPGSEQTPDAGAQPQASSAETAPAAAETPDTAAAPETAPAQ